MHTIIVCGTPWCEVKAIQQMLEVAGVSSARPAPSGSVTDIGTWHDRLFSNLADLTNPLSIGKAWELGASQIFLANWDQPVWGWADSRSTWLLDFWRDFDATTHFVLLYTPPETVLTRILADVASDRFDPLLVLDQWCAYVTELLKFFHRNQSRCVFLNADQALGIPNNLIQELNHHFKLALNDHTSELTGPDQPNPLDQWLAQQLLQSHPAALALEQEIQASLLTLQNVGQATLTSTAAVLVPEAADQLRQLYRRNANLLATANQNAEQLFALRNQVQNQQHTQQALQQENQALLLHLHQAQEELEKHFLQCQTLQQQNTGLAQEKAGLNNQIQNQQQTQQALQQENEALLLQLHLVQEELESNFLQCQTLEQKNTELAQEKASLHNQIQNQIQQELQQKHETLLPQLHQVQGELESNLLQCKTLQQKNTELAQEKAGLHNQIQNQQQAQQELQKENETLLLQLHQVQEELEHYFLLNQQSEQEKKVFETRWDRLVARYPDYCEWDHIEILDTAEGSARWLVHGLLSTGHTLPPIDVSLELMNGNRELLLYPPTQPAAAPLLYWSNPVGVFDAPLEPLRLQPDAAPASAEMQIVRHLGSTDLLRLQAICSALAQGMPATQPNREVLVQHLQDLQTRFKNLPATWRFDSVQLKHEQVNPGYEHLCFSLQNACFGERQWTEFEFRIGAANVKKGKFSSLPRLEFPLPAQGDKQFENWFNESENENGPKFELRFDIKANAIDIKAWDALNAKDKLQLLSIMAALPRILNQLEQQGTNLSRPWNDWLQLAIAMQKTMQSLGLPAITFEVV